MQCTKRREISRSEPTQQQWMDHHHNCHRTRSWWTGCLRCTSRYIDEFLFVCVVVGTHECESDEKMAVCSNVSVWMNEWIHCWCCKVKYLTSLHSQKPKHCKTHWSLISDASWAHHTNAVADIFVQVAMEKLASLNADNVKLQAKQRKSNETPTQRNNATDQ